MIILSSVYRGLINGGERYIPGAMKKIIKWDHPAGPKTIHFWAPFMKWVSDFKFLKNEKYTKFALIMTILRAWYLLVQPIWQDLLKNFLKIKLFHFLLQDPFGPDTQW